MRVVEIMSRELVTVGPDDRLRTVRMLFERYRFHHLLVVDGAKLLGVISDRDLLKSISPFIEKMAERPQDVATLERRVHQIMTRKPVTVPDTALVCDAAEVMLGNRVSCLPVVDANGKAVGIITWRDMLRGVCGVE